MTTRSTDQPNLQDTARGPVVPVLSPVTSPTTSPVSSARPHPWEMVEHPIKTLRFVNALRQDPHIALVRKLLYLLPMLLLLLAVLLPEGIIAALIAGALPLVGTSHQSADRRGHRLGVSGYRRLRTAGHLSPCSGSPAPCAGISSWTDRQAAAALTTPVVETIDKRQSSA